ncbi:MAG: IPT/TIG domain-containing protein [Candidatus Delongbacteria bacterium]|nr:IPT/TIG domain-containing protein [Candidatus Delongbacteria bacterium]
MKRIALFLSWIACGILCFSCQKSDLPASIYQPDTGAPTPVISSVTPPNSAYAGYTQITIQGENFSQVLENNYVYFNNVKATLLTASPTSLTLIPPLVAGDSFAIKIAVSGAFVMAEYKKYSLELLSEEYGGFSDVDAVVAMDCDKNENLFVLLSNEIVKVAPDQSKTRVTNEGISAPVGCRVGENGSYVFYAKTKRLYKVPVEGGATVTVNSAMTKEKIECFDFDANGNIFIAAKNGITRMKPDGTNAVIQAFTGTKLLNIRVFDGYVYAASADSIWRSPIQDADGTLGDKELVYDWKSTVGAAGGGVITSFTFSETGSIIASSELVSALYLIEKSSSGYSPAVPFLQEILNLPGSSVCWGNDRYLYYNIGNRVIRIKMEQKGAPYHGRG